MNNTINSTNPTYLHHSVKLLEWEPIKGDGPSGKDSLVAKTPEGTFLISYHEYDSVADQRDYWGYRTSFIPSNSRKKIWIAYDEDWYADIIQNQYVAENYIRSIRNIKDLDFHPLLQTANCLYVHFLHKVESEHKEVINKNIEKMAMIVFQDENNTHVVKNVYGKVRQPNSWKKWKKENL